MKRDREEQCKTIHGVTPAQYKAAYDRGFRNGISRADEYILCTTCDHYDPDKNCAICLGSGYHHKSITPRSSNG